MRHCRASSERSAESVPIIGVDVSLTENATLGSNRDFVLLWHDGGVDEIALAANELDMTAFLTSFDETCGFKAALDLAGLKPPQPRPRLCGPLADVKLGAARSAAPKLLLNWQGPLLR